MMEKRMGKLALVLKEVPHEDKFVFFGDKDSENIIVGWGSPKGAILEAIDLLKEEGLSAGFLQVRLINPLPAEDIKKILEGKQRVIGIEHNYEGQLGQLIREKTGIEQTHHILKYTGRPMTTTEVFEALKAILTGKGSEREVLMFGS
jgi:2-oxoglutarate ferredoxin oxidoreductase subunit alpha